MSLWEKNLQFLMISLIHRSALLEYWAYMTSVSQLGSLLSRREKQFCLTSSNTHSWRQSTVQLLFLPFELITNRTHTPHKKIVPCVNRMTAVFSSSILNLHITILLSRQLHWIILKFSPRQKRPASLVLDELTIVLIRVNSCHRTGRMFER